MTDMLNERLADKIVIANLLKELRKRNYMGKLLIDPLDGKFYVVHEQLHESLTDEQVEANLKESRDNIESIEKARAFVASLNAPAAPSAPVEPEQPVEPQQPQPSPFNPAEPQPAQPEQPQQAIPTLS